MLPPLPSRARKNSLRPTEAASVVASMTAVASPDTPMGAGTTPTRSSPVKTAATSETLKGWLLKQVVKLGFTFKVMCLIDLTRKFYPTPSDCHSA